MTSGTMRKSDPGTENWLSQLSSCVEAIGTEEFPRRLLNSLSEFTDFDFMVAFAYYRSEIPVCLYHTFDTSEHLIFVDDYLKGPYLLDPFFKACERKVDAGIYRLRDIAPDRFYQSEYYRSYYVQTGLSEEICYTLYLDDVAIVISLMRAGDRPRFPVKDFRLLERVAPLVESLCRRHWYNVSNRFSDAPIEIGIDRNSAFIEKAVANLFGSRITPRESQVITGVLEGHSSESIANDLGISVGTVRIHRRNVYAKLHISSQQELFAIFFQAIKNVRG